MLPVDSFCLRHHQDQGMNLTGSFWLLRAEGALNVFTWYVLLESLSRVEKDGDSRLGNTVSNA
jgi:hypothetical protein